MKTSPFFVPKIPLAPVPNPEVIDLPALAYCLREMYNCLEEMDGIIGQHRPAARESGRDSWDSSPLDLSAWGDPIDFPSIDEMLKDIEKASRGA